MKRIFGIFTIVFCLFTFVAYTQAAGDEYTSQLKELHAQHKELKSEYIKKKKELHKLRKEKFQSLSNSSEEKELRKRINKQTKEQISDLLKDYEEKRRALRAEGRELKIKRKEARRVDKDMHFGVKKEIKKEKRSVLIMNELDKWEEKHTKTKNRVESNDSD